MTRYRLVACSDGPLSEGDIREAVRACEDGHPSGYVAGMALKAALKGAGDGWVSVDDHLPDFNTRVLCWLNGVYEHGPGMLSPRSGMAEMVRHRGETMLGEWGAMFYEMAWKKIDATHAYVTHWQPLPAPPSAKGKV